MATYVVQGEEGQHVNVLGNIFYPGNTVDLQEDVAAPLVEAGVIAPEQVVEAEVAAEATPEAPVEPAAPEAPVDPVAEPEQAPAPEANGVDGDSSSTSSPQ